MFKCVNCKHEFQYPWSRRCPACGGDLMEVEE